MTSSLLRPRRFARAGSAAAGGDAGRDAAGSTVPTRILDWEDARVTALVRSIAATPDEGRAVPAHAGQVEALRRAHRRIAEVVQPVYSVQDDRPVSEVLRRNRGSCSQRLAVLEAVARAYGVATRVRGLLVDGTFWYPRFPRVRQLVPDRILLAWPEFRIDGGARNGAGHWLTVSELFGGLDELSGAVGGGFTNAGAETLFEALSRTAIDWDGVTLCPTDGAACDLSAYVLADLGHFDSRDELFSVHGQALCGMARLLAEPVLGRRTASGR
ncbi:transglutaminase domain-containing protein [Streptomyces xantholiticus]|uniref:transglutaminase domain-containing protein n=1 Tax=Streptomyces xantholiticus TaxID=68285 RepID=UPI00167B824F|nr:transglutaminase domain-containing protein [Streptomyces xantholiticus]GGW51758.1 hypothetical protein GCM10010381_41320 [Streptomyces xantholiticus]